MAMSPIRVEVGPMYSSKTTTLIAEIERHQQAERVNGRDFLVFNHASDTRFGRNILATHSKIKVEAYAVADSAELLAFVCTYSNGAITLKSEFQHLKEIFIDEAQFFDLDLSIVVEYLDRHLGVDVHLAGLDTDFRGETFGPMGDLMAIAHQVDKHTAICKFKTNGEICGHPATKTQRLVNGQPANYHDPIILVGAEEAYTARCDQHHQVPNKDLKNKLGNFFTTLTPEGQRQSETRGKHKDDKD
jgi:thymidine kinase